MRDRRPAAPGAGAARETARPDGFREVRDQAGHLLFRVRPCGIIEVKQRGGAKILVNIWDYLHPRPRAAQE